MDSVTKQTSNSVKIWNLAAWLQIGKGWINFTIKVEGTLFCSFIKLQYVFIML